MDEWEEAVEEIQAMLDDTDGRFDWAADTLRGIQDWVREHKHITDSQWTAVDNIVFRTEGCN